MTELRAVLRAPRVATLLGLGVAVCAGLIMVVQGWRGAAATLLVPLQVPYLVSGAVAGVALAGAGLGLMRVHLDRVEAAEERRRTAALQREVLHLLAVVTERR